MLAATLLGNVLLLGLDGWMNGLLGNAGYGLFSAVKRLLQLGGFVVLLGMENTVLRFVAVASDPVEARRVRRRAMAMVTVSGLLGAAMLAAGADVLGAWLDADPSTPKVLRVGALALPLGAVRMVAVAVAQARGRIGVRAVVMFVAWPLVQLAGAAWMARHLATPELAMAAYVAAMAVGAALAVAGMLRAESEAGWGGGGAAPSATPPPDGAEVRTLLTFAWPGWLQGIGMAAYTWADQVLLAGLRSVEAAGIYGPVATLAPLFGIGLQALSGPLAPEIAARHAAGDLPGLQASYRTVARVALLIAMPAVVLCVVAPAAVLGAWPNGDSAAVPALRITALAQLLCTGVGSVNLLLIMAGRPRAALANAVPALLLNLFLSAWLIPRMGVTGAALANAAAMVGANGLALAKVRAALGVHPWHTGLLRVAMAGVCAAPAVWLVARLSAHPLATLAVTAIVAGVATLGAYALLGIAPEERAWLDRVRARVFR